jgi:glycosyltransferase involved in cell wall biosynthesis
MPPRKTSFFIRKLDGYIRRLQFEYSQWRWRTYSRQCRYHFDVWRKHFTNSNAEVLVGMHLHKHGGVRNHLLAIKKHSSLRVALVPEETHFRQMGSNPFDENYTDFLNTPPPKSAFAVHTHVLPHLIDWATQNSKPSLKWIHTHHLLYYPDSGRNGIEPWQSRLNESMLKGARLSDICICVSRWEQQTLKNDYDIDSIYVPNGVDISHCDKANASRFLRRFRVDCPFVLWVGRLDPVKNPQEFIKLATDNPKVHFVSLGGITASDIEQEFLIAPPNNLTLLPQVPHQLTLDAIAACQILVVTSHREGLPTLVLEAMALGKTIIVPDEPGCLDATDGERCAVVYKRNTPGDISAKLELALSKSAANNSGRERVLSEFDWKVIAKRLDSIYQDL